MKKIITRIPQTTSEELKHLHPILKRIYQSRGITTAKELDYSLANLLPWKNLKGIQEAVKILAKVITENKYVLIVGDFDVDGATSCALAVRILRAMGGKKIHYLVPNRFTMGYGLTPEIVELAKQKGTEVLMTVDNGMASYLGVKAAKEAGMEVIITDHHLPGESLPIADAIVNPNQPHDTFLSKNLCGVGVVFYVLLALRAFLIEKKYFTKETATNMAKFLDLVALGTIADVVPLDHNNRILVAQGLQRICAGQGCIGIQALLRIANKNLSLLNATDLGFAIAPRLNAAGRLEDMSLGVECLLTDDMSRALAIAKELDDLNLQRRVIERDMQAEAEELLIENTWTEEVPAGICLFAENWHLGVIGILASRIKEKMYRPVICFAKESETILKGSARSIPGVHIRDILDLITKQHPDLIEKFGGHAMAAGLTIKVENFVHFKQIFSHYIEQKIAPEILVDTLCTDGELEDFTLELAETLNTAGPWGQHFVEPIFQGKFMVLHKQVLSGNHLRFTLQNGGKVIEAIAFNVETEWLKRTFADIDIVYRLGINEFRNNRKPQLIIEAII